MGEEARKKMFDSMDKKSTGVITVDEYKTFIKKAVTNVTGPENVELYWFMLELFTDHDSTKCGRVNISQFPAMMSELVKTPKKHGLSTPAEGQYETLFKKYDPRADGNLTIDEWVKLATEEVFKTIV